MRSKCAKPREREGGGEAEQPSAARCFIAVYAWPHKQMMCGTPLLLHLSWQGHTLKTLCMYDSTFAEVTDLQICSAVIIVGLFTFNNGDSVWACGCFPSDLI